MRDCTKKIYSEISVLNGRILGCSTYGRPDLVSAALHPEVNADYLGSGAIFTTPTKASEAKVPWAEMRKSMVLHHFSDAPGDGAFAKLKEAGGQRGNISTAKNECSLGCNVVS